MTVIENELSQRGALRKLGMDATERLPLDGKSKRKGQRVDLDDYECEVCRASLYVSMVSTTLTFGQMLFFRSSILDRVGYIFHPVSANLYKRITLVTQK